MRDIDVRQALHDELAAAHGADPSHLILDELGVCSRVRVDVALINGDFTGYEIKSPADTLRRLPVQAEIYSKVFDYASLVVAANHFKQALTSIPEWWGIQVATNTEHGIRLDCVRGANRNLTLDRMALAQLLWREEALEELSQRNADRGVRSKARWHVWTRLADVLTTDEMRAVVRTRLRARQGWRAVE